jgi:prepilin-type N-terminal cleavage/methylation domain-containing protein
MTKSPREQGFTLIEIIVVIVLFSLITTLSIQGIGYVLGQRARMAQFQQNMVTTTLRHQWFIEAIGGLSVPPEDEAYVFTGSAHEFHGFSIAPLINPELPGTDISWKISTVRGLRSLVYYQANTENINAEIPVVNGIAGEAYFRYLDETGIFHSQWPPAARSANRSRSNTLPEAISLYMGSGSEEISWLARIANAKNVKVTERFSE